MNTIIINFDEIKDKFTNYHTAEKFIFDKFKMIVNFESGEKLKIKVDLENGTLSGYAEVETSEIIYGFKFEQSGDTHLKVFCLHKEIQQIAFNAAQLITCIMEYIMTAKRDRVVKNKIGVKTKIGNDRNKHKEYDKKVFLLDEIVEYVRENDLNIDNKGIYKINCPCWSVRGHYRHYKSGKVIFIENYKKGKERENKEPKSKTYTV